MNAHLKCLITIIIVFMFFVQQQSSQTSSIAHSGEKIANYVPSSKSPYFEKLLSDNKFKKILDETIDEYLNELFNVINSNDEKTNNENGIVKKTDVDEEGQCDDGRGYIKKYVNYIFFHIYEMQWEIANKKIEEIQIEEEKKESEKELYNTVVLYFFSDDFMNSELEKMEEIYEEEDDEWFF